MKTSYQQQTDYFNPNTLMGTYMSSIKADYKSNLRDTHRVFHRKDNLFCAGDHFEGVYILRSGSAKSYILSRDGEEHITKFHYPGDIVGVDGFDKKAHRQTLSFLETSSVCFIKESEINNLLQTSPDFRHGLLQSMSHTLACDGAMMMCLSTYSSEQKVARFLLDLSLGFSERGLSGSEFILSMTRTDIANYLGMAIETVSRIFASLQLRGIIRVQLRSLTIVDFDVLNGCISVDVCPQPEASRAHSRSVKQIMN